MARDLRLLYVIDVECTCWQAGTPIPKMPDERYPDDQGMWRPQRQEIIQIGVAKLNLRDLTVLDKRGYFVKPYESMISPFCTELTGITDEDVKDAPGFKEVTWQMRDDFGAGAKNAAWASWGDFDLKMMKSACAGSGVLFDTEFPFGPTWTNWKNQFAVLHSLQREVGMDTALGICGLTLEGRHHRGDDDAWNIARVIATTLKGARTAFRGR